MSKPTKSNSPAKPRLRTVDRDQFVLRAMDIDQFIPDDHPARALWEFVDRLDLSGFYAPIKSVEGRPGKPGNDPRLMIALWLYAYSRGIGSARDIERQCEYEPGFQWLCALKPINHHSLSDFRVEYDKPLKDLFTQVLAVLTAEGLITLERVMHDGTRVRASASGNTFRTEKTLREHLEQARQHVEEMGDPQQKPPTARQTAARQRARREREQKLTAALEQLEEVRRDRRAENRNEARASETDPEARVMKRNGGGFEPSYNVQISTDAVAGVIVGLDVTQSGSDAPHLQSAVERLKKTFGKAPGQLVADAGYISSENIIALDGETDLIGPIQTDNPARLEGQRKRRGIAEQFAADKFVFLTELNSFRCPAEQLLPYYRLQDAPSGMVLDYKGKASVCGACSWKPQCCPQSPARTVRQLKEDSELSEFRSKMEKPEYREVYKQRSQISEFAHAWLKEKLKLRQFRVRGLKKVLQESLWAAMTYNIQQWIRLRWRPQLPALA